MAQDLFSLRITCSLILFVISQFFICAASTFSTVVGSELDYSIQIHSSAGKVKDWRNAPRSIWLEITFNRQVQLTDPSRPLAEIFEVENQTPVPVSLSWNPPGTLLKIIPLAPLEPGLNYSLRLNQIDPSESSQIAASWTTEADDVNHGNGFLMDAELVLTEPRSSHWTTLNFINDQFALITDSVGGVSLLQFHPITGSPLKTVEVARLNAGAVASATIRSIPNTNIFYFVFCQVPAWALSKSDISAIASENVFRAGTGQVQKWMFLFEPGDSSLQWLNQEILLNNIPFSKSSTSSLPLASLDWVEEATVALGIGPILNFLEEGPLNAEYKKRWSYVSSSILELQLEGHERWKSFLKDTDKDAEKQPGRFVATGIHNPSLFEKHPETETILALSLVEDVEKSYASPTGGGAPSIPFTTQPHLLRIQKGGYYGFPNEDRAEFVAYGGNPTAGLDPLEKAEYPIGLAPLKTFQSEDIFPCPFSGQPTAILGISSPHPLAGRFLICVERQDSGEFYAISIREEGRFLDARQIRSVNQNTLPTTCYWVCQRPGTSQLYGLGQKKNPNQSVETGLWLFK